MEKIKINNIKTTMPTPENNQQKIIQKNSKIPLMNQLYHCRKTTNKKPLKNSRKKIIPDNTLTNYKTTKIKNYDQNRI